MDKLLKLWPLLFLIGNIGEQTLMLMGYASIIFYCMLALSIPLLFHYKDIFMAPDCIKSFRFMYVFIGILIVYQFTFGMIVYNDRSWVYLVSKTMSTAMIIVSCYLYSEYNAKKLLTYFAYIIALLTFVGHFVFNISFHGRAYLGFVNPNSMGMLAALAFGILLITFDSEYRYKWFNIGCIAELLISTLQSGSRTAMGVILLAILFRFGLRIKNLIIAAISLLLLINVANEFGLETSAFERFLNTVENNNYSEGRENEREAALVMIKENPIMGNGLYATQSQEALKISQYGSHNGYLDFIKMLGIPIGSVFIIFLLYFAFYSIYQCRHDTDSFITANSFIVMSVCFASMNEAYLWGVNQPVTTIFFVALATIESQAFSYNLKEI